MEEFQSKYMKENSFEISLPLDKRIIEGSPKSLKRIEVKKNMLLLERGFALLPDSTKNNGKKVDSFYLNKFKKKYIKDNRLRSENIFLKQE